MQEAAHELKVPERSDDEIKNIIGLAMREAMLTLYPSMKDSEIHVFRDAYSKIYLHYDAVPSELFPGAMETMHTLKDQSAKLAIATGKSRKGLDRILKSLKLEAFFDFSRCADETASKPDPLMLNELLTEAEVPLKDAVMIGDTEWDMKMADRAGMRKIAVDYGAHTKERLQSCSPDMLISRFDAILDWRF
jgi:phosphoglycolate phosphatase